MEREQQQARRDKRYRTCQSSSKKSQELPTVDPALLNIGYNAAYLEASIGLAATNGICGSKSVLVGNCSDGLLMGRDNVDPHVSHGDHPNMTALLGYRPPSEVD